MQGRVSAYEDGLGIIETPRGNAFPFGFTDLIGKSKALSPGTEVDFLVDDEGRAVEVVRLKKNSFFWSALNSLIFL